MAIPFTCPFCGAHTEVDDRFAGTSGECATCGKTITIPAISQGAATASGGAAGGISVVTIVLIGGGVLLAGVCVIGILMALLIPAVQSARESARRAQCGNNLKRIGMAMQMYEVQYGTFPPAYLADEDGKPMHSWRVLLLPFLDEEGLYSEYRFDEPWDGPTNQALMNRMPDVFACPSDPQTASQETSYMVIVGPLTLFPGADSVGPEDCRDGLSNTLVVVETANSSVTWTEPIDLSAEQMLFEIGAGDGSEVGSFHSRGANVVFGDGHVAFLPDSISPEELRAMATRDGGEAVSMDY